MGHNKYVYSYMKKAQAFILSSLWEEPGFVIIEAALSNLFIISSDCLNGPREFVGSDNGILFSNNNIKSLEKSILKFIGMSNYEINCIIFLYMKILNTLV